MRVAFKGIPGVEKVYVSLNKGLADVDLTPGNTVTFRQLQDAITKNGFTTKQSNVIARGAVESADGKYRLKVSGTSDLFELVAGNPEQLQSFIGKPVEVRGTVPEASKGKVPDRIQVTRIEEVK